MVQLNKKTKNTKRNSRYIWFQKVKKVTKGCSKFHRILEHNPIMFDLHSSKSTDFVDRFSKKLKISEEYIIIAKRIAKNIAKLDIGSGHQPPSVAAACIMLMSTMCNLNLTKKFQKHSKYLK